jgi:hypothetical protein
MPKREPTSAEYDHLLQENDVLRLQLARLHSDLKRKQQTITKLIEVINKDEVLINDIAEACRRRQRGSVRARTTASERLNTPPSASAPLEQAKPAHRCHCEVAPKY